MTRTQTGIIVETCNQAVIDSQPVEANPLTQYIVVRADLPIGMIAAQVAHAAGAGSERHPPEVHVVVLSVPCEEALRDVSARLLALGNAQTLVVETDEPYRDQAMALGCELVRDRDPLRRALSSLPLLGKGATQKAA